MQIVERAAARAASQHRYYTGRACAKGHVADRYTQTGACVQCVADNVAASRAAYAVSHGAPMDAERLAFRREVRSVAVMLPTAAVQSVASIVGAMLVARYPLLAKNDRRFRLDGAPSRQDDDGAGLCRAWFNVHADDAPTLTALAANAVASVRPS